MGKSFVTSWSIMIKNDNNVVNLIMNLDTTEIKSWQYLKVIIYTFPHTVIEYLFPATHGMKCWLCTDMKEMCPVPNGLAAAAKSLHSCPTRCDPIDGSPPGPAIPGILQAITLEWVAVSFSNAWNWKVKVKSLSRVPPSVTPWTAAHRAPPSMGLSRQKYWSGVPLPSLNGLAVSVKLKVWEREREEKEKGN